MPLPKKGVAYTFSLAVFDANVAGAFKASPTIAAGDFKISKDNGALANLTNLPTNTPSGSVLIQFVLTSTEMNADRISVVGIDAAGAEWSAVHHSFDTTVQTVDDIPTALQNADALLKRDWTALSGEPAYCLLQAARFLRNVWAIVAGSPPVLTVRKEDGTTAAWSRNVATDAAADPITGVTEP